MMIKYNSDYKLIALINKRYNVLSLSELTLDKKKKIIKEIYKSKNTSIRQLSRVLGIGKAIVESTVKKNE